MHHTPTHKTIQQAILWSRPHQASCHKLVTVVSRATEVPVSLLLQANRSGKVARARQIAMYLSHVVLGHSLSEVGRAFGRDRTTVSYACALVEDRRDDPAFDAEIDAIERQLEEAGLVAE